MRRPALAALLRDLRRQGFRIEHRRRHYVVFPPERDRPPVTISGTPSDCRSEDNLRADLRRAGWRDR